MHYLIFYYVMLLVFRSKHHFSWKFQKFLRMMKLYKYICSTWISCTSAKFCYSQIDGIHVLTKNRSTIILQKTFVWVFGKWFIKTSKKFISQQTYLYIQVTDILKSYEVLFCTYFKTFFVFKKKSLCLYSFIYA